MATPLTGTWDAFRRMVSEWRRLSEVPPPDTGVFLQRVRFIEWGIATPVKAVVVGFLVYYLFLSRWFYDLTPPRADALVFVRNFFFLYTALNTGAAIILWGLHEVSAKVVERVVYSVALLDGVALAALTLVTGGFDSPLYWLFIGLIIRNAAVVPRADVQILVNFLVSMAYVLAGVLDLSIERVEQDLIDTVNLPNIVKRAVEPVAAPGQEPIESLILRVLLLLLVTACCYGIQVLVDRRRREEIEAQEFAFKQHQLQAAGRLAAEIAHQLKNPLGIINNAAYSLQRTVKEGKTITQQIAIIREEVARSDRIITELMGYAQLAEGKVERINVPEELDRAVTAVLPAGSAFDIRVTREYGPALPPLLGQRAHFAEVFTNLLTNAREAMGGRGEIHLSVHAAPDYSVRIVVRDNGPGIPPEALPKVFEPYFTTKERGTGLGLAIVRHNTELYGGTVHVESELGKGATFTLAFPARSVMRLRK